MKFTASQSALLEALNTVSNIIGRPSRPILGNVLVKASSDGLALTTFNEQIGITIKVAAEVEIDGEYTFPAKFFAAVVDPLPDMPLLFELEDQTLKIQFLGGDAQINGISAEDYPALPTVEATGNAFDPALLTGPIKKAMVSVSDDESKMVLCGVHIADYKIDAEDEQGKLEFAATNGHHLAVAVSEIDTPENWEPITVPTNALRSLIKLTGKSEVTIAADRALI